MTLDFWALILLGTFAATGAMQGLSGQVARVLALLGATALSVPLGPAASKYLPAWFPPTLGPAIGGLIGVGVVTYLLSFALRHLARRVVAGREWGLSDRIVGGALGGAQGFYLAWVLATLLPLVNVSLGQSGSRFRFGTAGSVLARFSAQHPLPFGDEILRPAVRLQQTLERYKAPGAPPPHKPDPKAR